MNNISEKFRQCFVDECRKIDITTEELRKTIDFIKEHQPTIFTDHSESSYFQTPQTTWSPGYFEECVKGIEDVFSVLRIEHLLKVRDFLRQRGDAGFKPGAPRTPGVSTAMHTEFHPKKNLGENFQIENFDLLRSQIALQLEIYDISNDSIYLTQAIQWAEKRVSNIFLPYEEDMFKKPISEVKSDWNPDYFDIQTEYLSRNFSKERYLHLIEVRQYLRDHRVEGFVPPRQQAHAAHADNVKQATSDTHAENSTASSHPHGEPPSPGSMSHALHTTLMIGGAIAALLVLVLSMTR